MENSFAIVKFVEEDDAIDVVSVNWINEGGETCMYPKNQGEKSRLCKANAEPMDDWMECKVSVLKFFDNFQDARSKLKKAAETSTLETSSDEENQPRKRRFTNLSLPGEESDEENQFKELTHRPKKFKSVLKLHNLSPNHSPQCPTFSIPHSTKTFKPTVPKRHNFKPQTLFNSPPSPNYPSMQCTGTPRSKSKESSRSPSFADQDLRRILCQLQASMGEVISKLNAQEKWMEAMAGKDVLVSEDPAMFSKLPLNSMEDFDVLENELNETSFSKSLTKILISIGGKDCRNTINNIMRKLFTDELAMKFSYTGKIVNEAMEKKRPFGDTKICSVIHRAVLKVFVNEKEVDRKKAMSLWLQQAKSRTSRKQKKNNDNTYNDEEDSDQLAN